MNSDIEENRFCFTLQIDIERIDSLSAPDRLGRDQGLAAFRLLDEGTHHAISVCDTSGNVLCGVRLQLKLGLATE